MTAHDKFFSQKQEWSMVKDNLLSCYLCPYFVKILKTGQPVVYVDGFAGPGKFDDGTEGSPLLALHVASDAIKLSKHRNNIRMYFIESNSSNYSQLYQNVMDAQKMLAPEIGHYVKAETHQGNCSAQIRTILESAMGCNVFLYLDPFGIVDLDFSLIEVLCSKQFASVEVLVNFNSFGFFRAACKALKIEIREDDLKEVFAKLNMGISAEDCLDDLYHEDKSVNRLIQAVGSDYWIDVVQNYNKHTFDALESERKLAKGFANNLRKYFRFVLDMPIRVKSGHIPKYRMIHASNHADACFLMADNIQHRKDELIYKVQKQEEISLFDGFQITGQGDLITESEVMEYLQDMINGLQEETRYNKFMADFVNKYGILCPFSRINYMLRLLENRGILTVRRVPELTCKGRISSFWSEKGGNKIFLKRCV